MYTLMLSRKAASGAPRVKQSGALRQRLAALRAQFDALDSFVNNYGDIEPSVWADATQEEIDEGLAWAASSSAALTQIVQGLRELEKEADAIADEAHDVSGDATMLANELEDEIEDTNAGAAALRMLTPAAGY